MTFCYLISFSCSTDNHSHKYALPTVTWNSRTHICALELQMYSFEIRDMSGQFIVVADIFTLNLFITEKNISLLALLIKYEIKIHYTSQPGTPLTYGELKQKRKANIEK